MTQIATTLSKGLVVNAEERSTAVSREQGSRMQNPSIQYLHTRGGQTAAETAFWACYHALTKLRLSFTSFFYWSFIWTDLKKSDLKVILIPNVNQRTSTMNTTPDMGNLGNLFQFLKVTALDNWLNDNSR